LYETVFCLLASKIYTTKKRFFYQELAFGCVTVTGSHVRTPRCVRSNENQLDVLVTHYFTVEPTVRTRSGTIMSGLIRMASGQVPVSESHVASYPDTSSENPQTLPTRDSCDYCTVVSRCVTRQYKTGPFAYSWDGAMCNS
jgi:hypothetical protein